MNISEMIILVVNTISFSFGFACISYIFTLVLADEKISFFELFCWLGLIYLLVSITFIFAGIPCLAVALFIFLLRKKIPLIKNILVCIASTLAILITAFVANMVFYAMNFSSEHIKALRELVSYNLFFSIEWVVSSLIISFIIYCGGIRLFKYRKNISFIEQYKPDKMLYLVMTNIFFVVLIIAGVEFAIVAVDATIAKYVLIFGNILTLIAVAFSALSLFLITKIISQRTKEIEIKKDQELTMAYKQEIQNMYNEIRDFKHDYMKIYTSMSTMLADNNIEAVKEFFNNEIIPLQQNILSDAVFTHSITLISDSIIQGLIYSYVIKARNNGIKFHVDIQEKIDASLHISSVNLSRILGILLDNAFEEAEKTKEKDIILAVIRLPEQIIYVIKNIYDTAPDMSKIFLREYSTKGATHGRGLSIVQNLCNNYNNIYFNIKLQNGYFIAELIIDITD